MILKVEQKHIEAGVPGDPQHCPVALAIREALGRDDLELFLGDDEVGQSLRRSIEEYDRTGLMEPCEIPIRETSDGYRDGPGVWTADRVRLAIRQAKAIPITT